VEEDEDVVELLDRQVDVAQLLVHVVGVEVALLAAFGHELTHLFAQRLQEVFSRTLVDGFALLLHVVLLVGHASPALLERCVRGTPQVRSSSPATRGTRADAATPDTP